MTDFTKPGFYRTRNSQKAEIITPKGEWLIGMVNDSPFQWQTDGKVYKNATVGIDLIEPWSEL